MSKAKAGQSYVPFAIPGGLQGNIPALTPRFSILESQLYVYQKTCYMVAAGQTFAYGLFFLTGSLPLAYVT